MSSVRTLRQGARRTALIGTATGYRLSRRSAQLWDGPRGGLGVLLLHNTIGRHADSLMTYAEKHRDRFTDFTAIETLSTRSDRAQLALTFDDGFRSNLTVARRLAALDLQACFYVPTDVIGMRQSDVDTFFGRPQAEGVVTWDDLEELISLGHVVGSHCRQHRALADQSDAAGEDQVKGSLETLRSRLGQADHFAWPFGSLRHADAAKVVRWCSDVGAVAASGVRGFNTPDRFEAEGYLRRDAVDLRWLGIDVEAFLGRDASPA